MVTYQGLYDGEKDELKMQSSEGKRKTRMVDSLGDDLTAKWISVGTEDDENAEHWEADEVDGKFYSDDQDFNQNKNGKPASTMPAAPIPAQPNPTPVNPTPQPAKPTTSGSGGTQLKRQKAKIKRAAKQIVQARPASS